MTTGHRTSFNAAYFEQPTVAKSPEAAGRYAQLLQPHLPAQSTVVDVGCAMGSIVGELKRTTAWRMIGIDMTVSALRQAPEGVARSCASADRLPLRTGGVDAALFLDVIEHLESPVTALGELRRIVRPGGMLVVTTPNAGSPLRPLLGPRWHGLEDETHLYFFTAFSLTHLLSKAGWQACRTVTHSGASGPVGKLITLSRSGGELCIVATTIS